MRLFKYAPLERIDILLTGLIRYTQPSDLNDPYEMRLDFSSLTHDDQSAFAAYMVGDAMLEGAGAYYDNLTGEVRSALGLTREQYIASAAKTVEDPNLRSALAQAAALYIKKVLPALNQPWIDFMNKTCGILCFSEIPDNLLMWSHYANYHNGIVIEFDSSHSTFNCRRADTDEFYYLRKVEYSISRPLALDQHDATTLLLTKAVDWDYEKEWRIIKLLSDAKQVNDKEPFRVYLLEIPAACIKRVIFGSRVKAEQIADLVSKVRSCDGLNHVQLTRASLRFGDFGLNIDNEV